jgi:Tfp pilus assembly protein FimT
MRAPLMPNFSAGFHVTELLAGLLLCALLVSLAASSFAGLVQKKTLRFEAMRLKATLQQLMLDARQREEDMLLEVEARRYTARRKGVNGGVLFRYQFKQPVRARLAAGQMAVVACYRSGANTPATLVLEDGKSSCKVVLSLRGRINVRCGKNGRR